MHDRSRRVDAFPMISGLLGIATGPILLMRGAPAGWSFLLIAAGITLLAVQWAIANDVQFEITRAQVLATLVGIACLAIAVVYLTRSADDLPSLFPGHDGDSEQFRLLPGILTLAVGLVFFGRGLASALPARSSR
jgi:hypothetical protein